VLYQSNSAQICDKKTRVFFESDKYSISSAEEKKLRSLTSLFSQKTDTFLLEIYAFTDSIASKEYNYKLAQNRFKSIANYLKKNSAAHFEIMSKVRGEADPLSSNDTEAGRAKNRRVEIFHFKINGGRVTLKGKGGMEMAVEKNYFAPRGICECNPQLMEIYTNQEAARAGIDLTTTDGCALITGGMISLSFEGQDANRCTDVIIKIPGSEFDEEMEIWNSTPVSQTQSMSNWFRESSGQLEYDEETKFYTLTVKLCPGNRINLDKINRRAQSLACRDSAGVIALPELSRPKRFRNFGIGKSSILTKEGVTRATVARFPYKGRGQVNFVDSGISKEKIGYYFSGTLDGYERECDSARCTRLKECWCYEIPLSEYTKLIYFQKKKNYRLKVPMKYKNYSVRLYIPAADTTLAVEQVEGSRRKYTFKQPLPDTYVVLYKESSNTNNKREYDYQVDLDKVRKKYSKRNKVYKAKIKRKQLKHPL
jgi:hypothetical protein